MQDCKYLNQNNGDNNIITCSNGVNAYSSVYETEMIVAVPIPLSPDAKYLPFKQISNGCTKLMPKINNDYTPIKVLSDGNYRISLQGTAALSATEDIIPQFALTFVLVMVKKSPDGSITFYKNYKSAYITSDGNSIARYFNLTFNISQQLNKDDELSFGIYRYQTDSLTGIYILYSGTIDELITLVDNPNYPNIDGELVPSVHILTYLYIDRLKTTECYKSTCLVNTDTSSLQFTGPVIPLLKFNPLTQSSRTRYLPFNIEFGSCVDVIQETNQYGNYSSVIIKRDGVYNLDFNPTIMFYNQVVSSPYIVGLVIYKNDENISCYNQTFSGLNDTLRIDSLSCKRSFQFNEGDTINFGIYCSVQGYVDDNDQLVTFNLLNGTYDQINSSLIQDNDLSFQRQTISNGHYTSTLFISRQNYSNDICDKVLTIEEKKMAEDMTFGYFDSSILIPETFDAVLILKGIFNLFNPKCYKDAINTNYIRIKKDGIYNMKYIANYGSTLSQSYDDRRLTFGACIIVNRKSFVSVTIDGMESSQSTEYGEERIIPSNIVQIYKTTKLKKDDVVEVFLFADYGLTVEPLADTAILFGGDEIGFSINSPTNITDTTLIPTYGSFFNMYRIDENCKQNDDDICLFKNECEVLNYLTK